MISKCAFRPAFRAAAALTFCLSTSLAVGCSGDGGDDADSARAVAVPPPPAPIATPAGPYRPVEVSNGGAVSGRVLIDSMVPDDPPIVVTVDSNVCGATLPDVSLLHDGPALQNAVVWISDVRSGKALPLEKRLAVTQDNCRLEPRIQGAVVGTTVNVRSVDPLLHRTVVRRGGSSDTISVIRTNDAGQVVPEERIGKVPGLVELTCMDHPWTRAYVAVFDNPYFSVTDERGRFRIDSLPPGKYHLTVWHERGLRPTVREITVTAGGDLKLDVKLDVKVTAPADSLAADSAASAKSSASTR